MNNTKQNGLDASYGATSASETLSIYSDWAASYDEEFAGRSGKHGETNP